MFQYSNKAISPFTYFWPLENLGFFFLKSSEPFAADLKKHDLQPTFLLFSSSIQNHFFIIDVELAFYHDYI